MTTITDYSKKDLPQRYRDMLDGKHDGRGLDAKGIMSDLRDLDAAKARLKALLYIEGFVTGDVLYNMAADEIESLRAQVEDHIANALVRAHRQCIAVEALTALSRMAMDEEVRRVAAKAVAQIGEVTK